MAVPWIVGGLVGVNLIALLASAKGVEKIELLKDFDTELTKRLKKNVEETQSITSDIKEFINTNCLYETSVNKYSDEELAYIIEYKVEINNAISHYVSKIKNSSEEFESINSQVEELFSVASKYKYSVTNELMPLVRELEKEIEIQRTLINSVESRKGLAVTEYNRRLKQKENEKLINEKLEKIRERLNDCVSQQSNIEKEWMLEKKEKQLDSFAEKINNKQGFISDVENNRGMLKEITEELLEINELFQKECMIDRYKTEYSEYETKITLLYKDIGNIENLFKKVCNEYKEVYEKKDKIKNVMDSYFQSLNNIKDDLSECMKKVEKSKWHRIDDFSIEELSRVDATRKKIMENVSSIQPIGKIKYFAGDVKNVNNKLDNLKTEIISECENMEEEMKIFWNQYMISAEKTPSAELNSNREQVYIEYDAVSNRTLLQINGDNVSNDSGWILLQQKPLEEWFDIDNNWKGFANELVNEINDDFDICFSGTEKEFEFLKQAFDEAKLDDFEYSINFETNQ